MMELDRRHLVAEELQIDDREARFIVIIEWWKAIARRAERVCVYGALIMGFLLVGSMVARCVPATYRYLTSSPAPRSSAPQAIANPQHAVVEADRAPTVQVR